MTERADVRRGGRHYAGPCSLDCGPGVVKRRSGLIDCAKQAWEGRKGCKKQIRNPSAEPCGWKARPVTPDQRPEVSLAWGEATSTAKRRQRVRKPCYGASKDPSREPWPFDNPGPRRGTVAVWCPRSCRRRCGTCANGQSRVPKNLGDPVVSSVEPGWSYRVTNSRPQRRTRPPRSEKNEGPVNLFVSRGLGMGIAAYFLTPPGIRSSNTMAKWFNAAFQPTIGIVHRFDAS